VRRGGLWAKNMGLKLSAIGNTHWGTTWEHSRTPPHPK